MTERRLPGALVQNQASFPEDAPTISVIIPTYNRPIELANISLPSLARQIAENFEVIVWDASEGEEAERAVKAFQSNSARVVFKYFRASRLGSAAQRNDAVQNSKGKVIFFY